MDIGEVEVYSQSLSVPKETVTMWFEDGTCCTIGVDAVGKCKAMAKEKLAEVFNQASASSATNSAIQRLNASTRLDAIFVAQVATRQVNVSGTRRTSRPFQRAKPKDNSMGKGI